MATCRQRPIAIRRFSRAAGAAFAVMLLGGCAHFDSHYGTARIELVRQLTLNPDAAREEPARSSGRHSAVSASVVSPK